MHKIQTAAVAAFAALAVSAGSSIAAPPDRGEGTRGDGADRGRVEKSEGPREMRRGDRDFSGKRDRDVGDRDYSGKRDRDVNVNVRVDRNRGDGNWRRAGYRDRIVRGHRYNWGPGVAFYFTDGYYYGECGWLKRRARATGNPIWWQRYHRCRDYS